MKHFFTFIFVLSSLFTMAETSITWTATALEDESSVLTTGTLVEALNFSSGTTATDFDATVNGVEFKGAVSGGENNAFDSPSFDYFSANSTNVVPPAVDNYKTEDGGLEVFDALLSKFLWHSADATVITINNLTVGKTYAIQLLVGDTRTISAESFILLNTEFGSAETTTFGGAGLSIIGTFKAEETSVSINFNKVTGESYQGISLNAYQLREVPESKGILWEAKTITGEASVITNGSLVEALNFSSGTAAADFNTTINGVEFKGAVSGGENNAFDSPSFDYFSSNSTNVVPPAVDNYKTEDGGLELFDPLLSKFLWHSADVTVITINNLTVGKTYAIQLLIGDTRANATESFIVLNTDFGSYETTRYGGPGLSIVGTFKATETSISIDFNKVTGEKYEGISLNGYQLRDLSSTATGFSVNQVKEKLNVYYINSYTLQVELQAGEIVVYNISGQPVDRIQVTGKAQINTSGYSSGLYIVKSTDNRSAKFIVD